MEEPRNSPGRASGTQAESANSTRADLRQGGGSREECAAADLSLNEEEAFQTMQPENWQRRKSMQKIAGVILLAEDRRRTRATI
jgi:hypothetical protein